MTIAAGFAHREGVLLCADTELTTGHRKLHASKIFHFDCALGRFAFVFAGHVHNAVATLQKIEAALTKARRNALGVMEHVLDREYKRLVLSRPAPFQDDFDFALIFAFRPQRDKYKCTPPTRLQYGANSFMQRSESARPSLTASDPASPRTAGIPADQILRRPR